MNDEERRETAREIGKGLARSKAPAHVILPLQGIEEWDKPGDVAHDPDGLAAFRPPVAMTEVDAHINDQAFADAALSIFDGRVTDGIVQA